MVDPDPESPVEEIDDEIEQESFVEEQRISDAADELSEWGPATDSHPMQTRTRTALQEGRPRRRFEQYVDYSSSEDQSMEEGVPQDVRLPPQEEPEDFFMEDLFVDTEDEIPVVESPPPEAFEGELYPNFATDEWVPEPTPVEGHMSEYSLPDIEDPLDSILRRQLPGQTRYSESCDSETDSERPVPTKSEEERLPTKRMRRPPQRYSPPINTEPVPGPSRLPTGTDRTVTERKA